MTFFTNLSGEKNKIQRVHESGISLATWKCQVLTHFNKILMHCLYSTTHIPKQKLPHCSVAFLHGSLLVQQAACANQIYNLRPCQ